MILFIKNMVCNRCKTAVKNVLELQGLHPISVELGEVELSDGAVPADQLQAVSNGLEALGFELIDDRKSRIIEKIKTLVIDLVHYKDEPLQGRYSEVIARELHYDYPYLSKLFSEVEGVTIEQYIISQKVEKIKEYIVYDELTLTEIADRMGYSSVAHLSAQFKKATGLPPSHFKNIDAARRKPLDKISQ